MTMSDRNLLIFNGVGPRGRGEVTGDVATFIQVCVNWVEFRQNRFKDGVWFKIGTKLEGFEQFVRSFPIVQYAIFFKPVKSVNYRQDCNLIFSIVEDGFVPIWRFRTGENLTIFRKLLQYHRICKC